MKNCLLLLAACAAGICLSLTARGDDAGPLSSANGWVTPPGGQDHLAFDPAGLAAPAGADGLRWELADARGKVLQAERRAFHPGQGDTFRADLAALPPGEYLARAKLLRGEATVAGWEHSLAVAGPDDAFILFEKEPVARGLTFDRAGGDAESMTAGDCVRWAWTPRPDGPPRPDWRTLRLRLTDERFRHGRMPVVDLSMAFRQPVNETATLDLDTAAGRRTAAIGRGPSGPDFPKNPPFQVLAAPVDNARFAPPGAPGNGDDLRCGIHAAAGSVRSVFIHGYDLASPAHWPRLLAVRGFDSDRPRLLWSPGEQATVNLHLANLARVPYAAPCRVALTDDQERPIWSRETSVDVPAGGVSATAVRVDTTGLRQGVYLLGWTTPDGVVSATALLTVAGLDPLPKAKEGESLYGIDMAAPYTDDLRLDWVDWCGMDLVRNFGLNSPERRDSPDDLGRALAALRRRGRDGTLMLYPMTPFSADPGEFERIIAQKAAFAGQVAARFKGTIRWYEVGNEPDQYHFFAGGGANYVRLYCAVRDAIKAADPAATVSNGGLCLHDNYGEKTAHEIIRLLPPDKIDAWAYHAHGAGSAAERNIFDQLTAATAARGEADKPFFSTESGFACSEPVSYRIQARTVVQKNVFAQSTGRVKMFYWFGMHPDWVFGLLATPNQARPGALAYRVMVQRTRGRRARGPLDLQGAPGEAYWLADDRGEATVVLWSNGAEWTRQVALGAGARDATLYDLFGNATPAAADADGRVQVNVGADPVYLCARTAPGARVSVLPPAVEVRREWRAVPGTVAALRLVVHNASEAAPLDGEVSVTPQGAVPVGAAAVRVSVPPGGSRVVSVPLRVADAAPDWWPRSWRVFAPVEGDIDLARCTELPATLRAGDAVLTPQTALPADGRIDLKALTGGSAERRQALCFAEVEAPADLDAEVGASADFWMEWWVNGRSVYSTLEGGNGNLLSLLAHTFPVHLHRGKNLLAVRVLSGQGGWVLLGGGPAANDGGDPTRRAPDAAFGTVTNFHLKDPDDTKWYQGPADLSGRVWFGATGDGALRVTALVRDDIATPGDGVTIKLAAGPDFARRLEFGPGSAEVTARRDDAAGTTRYEALIPAARLGVAPGELFAAQVTVADDDWGAPKQSATLCPSDDPADWPALWIAPRHE